jgi:solute carrier family 23 (nucleobase transporter), member 1
VEDDLDPTPGRSRRPRRRIDLRGELQIPPGFGRESAEPDTWRGGARGDATRRNDDVERGQAPTNAGRNGNRALADADVRKKAEDAEAKRKAEEAEAEARRKKEDEEWDADLAAYYQEQWATEDEGATGAAAATAETAPLAAV